MAATSYLRVDGGNNTPTLFTLSDQVGQFIVRYNPFDNYLFVGHAGDREIRTFYRPDARTIDPLQEAIELAAQKRK